MTIVKLNPNAGETIMIYTGIAMWIPDGIAAILPPPSARFKRDEKRCYNTY